MISNAPAGAAKAVTPSDVTSTAGCRGLYVGGTGDLTLDFDGGITGVVFTAVPAGTVLPVAPVKVRAATTATAIVALY